MDDQLTNTQRVRVEALKIATKMIKPFDYEPSDSAVRERATAVAKFANCFESYITKLP